MNKEIDKIDNEKIYNSLIQVLISDNPSEIIKTNKEEFFEQFPELKACYGFEQKNSYHIYDVFEHTMKVLDNTQKNISLRLAALFHDIGKPNTFFLDDNGIGHFYEHDKESVKLFENIANRIKIDESTKKATSFLIENHDKSLNVKKSKMNHNISEYGIENIDLLYDLKIADVKGQNPIYIDRIEQLNLERDKYHRLDDEKLSMAITNLQINGRKLYEMGFKGKEIGFILKDTLTKVANGKIENNQETIEKYVLENATPKKR